MRTNNQYYTKMLFDEKDYNAMLTHMQSLESYRNKIKGKPTLEEAIQLLCNEEDINFYKFYLFHYSFGNCDCRRCKLIEKNELNDEKYDFVNKLNNLINKYETVKT